MVVEGRSVFISYRRQLSWQLAQLVHRNLIEHDFDAFMDIKNLDSGEFDRRILSEIEARMHFIVLLEPGSLDRIGEDGDWLRREIAHALAHDRNVVPVTARGFELRRDLMLPPDVARLPSLNGVAVAQQPEYFNAAMKRLRTKFLKIPPKPAIPPRPVTRSDQRARVTQAPRRPSSSASALILPAPQLTGERERGDAGWVRLSWSEVSGASEYVLERSNNSRGNFFNEVYRGPDRSHNELPPGFLAFSGLRYRVRADAYGQAGRWSDILFI